MAKPKKIPVFEKVKITQSGPPQAPWRAFFDAEDDAGKKSRKFKSFSTLEKCIAFAEEKNLEIINHGVRFGDVPAEVRRAYDSFRDVRLDLETLGVIVPPFEQIISDAVAHLKSEAAAGLSRKVADEIGDFLSYKKSRVKDRQQKDLRLRLKRFAQTFGTRPVASIQRGDVETWLGELRSHLAPNDLLGALARNHHRAAIHSFFAWLMEREVIDTNPVSKISKEAVQADEVAAYSVADVRALLDTAQAKMPDLLPFLALGFFAGMRTSEIEAFDLGSIDLSSDEFRVSKSKTGARLVPISDSLRAWLQAQPRRTGPVCSKKPRQTALDVAELHTLAGVAKINNGVRHSYVSYAVAESRNESAVADIVGNSPRMVRKHYRSLVSAVDAKTYFSLRPTQGAGEIIQLLQA